MEIYEAKYRYNIFNNYEFGYASKTSYAKTEEFISVNDFLLDKNIMISSIDNYSSHISHELFLY